jgi:GTP-binding protein
MFVDQVKILVKGGDGGNGCVSFRREAHVPRGGPDGGVGGKGGDVVLVAVSHQNTLLSLRYQPEHRAERGGHGGPGNRTGHDGAERIVSVPPGTSARDEGTGEPVGEVLREGDRLVVARGGQGGRGNRSFLSNRNRAPREADPGEAGEERLLQLDLRLFADVGLLGLPNAGKSTLLSRLSAARPKVADYPFTTLSPVLGVVEADERTFVAADIPGIIEGAHEGAGLGLQFLRHVERTRVLLHVVDASGLSGREPADDLALVREEVRRHAPTLLERPQLVAASKRDLAGADDPLPGLLGAAAGLGLEVVPVSAATGEGLLALKRRLLGMIAVSLAAAPPEEPA